MRSAAARPSLPLAVALAALLGACEDRIAEAPGVIERETFIETYVDLRVTALSEDDAVLDDAERAEVLSRHGVSEEQLIEFARVHGTDPEFMREVWNQVEERLDARPPREPDGGS